MASLSERLQTPAAKWTLVGLASVGVAAVGTAAYLLYNAEQRKRRERAEKKKAAEAPVAAAEGKKTTAVAAKKKKKVVKKPSRKTPADVPRDEDLLAHLNEVMQTIEGKDGAPSPDGPEIKQAITWIRKMAPEEYTNVTRAAAGKFLMAYYNIMIISAIQNGHEEMFNNMQRALIQDQGLVWAILDYDDSQSPTELDADPILHMLRLEISQRYQPHKNFARSFDQALAFCTTGDHSMLMMQLFMSAPILGRWADFEKLGPRAFPRAEFEEKLIEFHETALQASQQGQQTPQPIFDCKVLWNMCKEHKELLTVKPTTDLKWETYTVLAVKMILKKAEHSEGEEKEEGIRQDAKQQPNDWVAIPGGHPLRRWGALAEMISISPLTMPMYGPMHDGSIMLQQFLDMPEDQPDPVRQAEEYQLKYIGVEDMPHFKPAAGASAAAERKALHAQVAGGLQSVLATPKAQLWRGTYVMTQTPLKDSTRPRVSLTYEMSLFIDLNAKPSSLVQGGGAPTGGDDEDDQ